MLMEMRQYLPVISTLLLTAAAPIALGYYISQQKASSTTLEQRAATPISHAEAAVREGQEARMEPNYHNLDVPLQQLTNKYPEESLERRIVIKKSERVLEAYIGDSLLKQYPVSLGHSPAGDKIRQGDKRTPEGEFYVAKKVPNSRFNKALLVSYPNEEDAERGLQTGLITQRQHDSIVSAIRECTVPPQDTALGSHIEIHGSGGGPDIGDWTFGCVALDSDYMEEVFAFAEAGCRRDGTPGTVIEILP